MPARPEADLRHTPIPPAGPPVSPPTVEGPAGVSPPNQNAGRRGHTPDAGTSHKGAVTPVTTTNLTEAQTPPDDDPGGCPVCHDDREVTTWAGPQPCPRCTWGAA